MRICFFGDSFTQGVGDEAGLGWVGRLIQRVAQKDSDATGYNLGIRRDTSLDIAARWKEEAARRLPDKYPKRLVFAFGTNDCARGDGDPRVQSDVSVRTLRMVLSEAKAVAPVLTIGPLPVFDDKEVDARVCALCARYELACRELGVNYVPLAQFALGDSGVVAAAKRGDGTHPDGSGYAIIAERLWAEERVRNFFASA